MSDEQEQHDVNVATPLCLTRQGQLCNLVVPRLPNQVHAPHKQRDTIQFLLFSWNGENEEIHYQMITFLQPNRRDQSALTTSINTSA